MEGSSVFIRHLGERRADRAQPRFRAPAVHTILTTPVEELKRKEKAYGRETSE
jgi:hypothetical protein